VLGVSHTTISRWRNDPSFQAKVEEHRSFIRKATELGRWPPKKSADASGLLKLEPAGRATATTSDRVSPRRRK
jgi:hypothetical protein